MKTQLNRTLIFCARSFGAGVMFTAGIAFTALLAQTATAWTNGETLTATKLNAVVTDLNTLFTTDARWTKNGTSAYYNAGNVGIGTTAPTNKIEIVGGGVTLPYSTDQSTALRFRSSGGNSIPVLGVKNAGDVFLRTIDNGANAGLVYQDSAGTDRLKIQNDGRVGIGTTAPASNSTLHVGAGADTPALTSAIYASNNGDTYITARNSTADVDTVFGSTGSLGLIGTRSNHGFLIQVNANNHFSFQTNGDMTAAGCVVANGGGATLGTCSSDRRLKKDIRLRTFHEPLQSVLGLSVKSFLSTRYAGVRATGLVAQDVEETVPELVTTDAAGYKRIHYADVQWLHIQATQELARKLETAQRENSALRDRLSRIETMLASRGMKLPAESQAARSDKASKAREVVADTGLLRQLWRKVW